MGVDFFNAVGSVKDGEDLEGAWEVDVALGVRSISGDFQPPSQLLTTAYRSQVLARYAGTPRGARSAAARKRLPRL